MGGGASGWRHQDEAGGVSKGSAAASGPLSAQSAHHAGLLRCMRPRVLTDSVHYFVGLWPPAGALSTGVTMLLTF
jgi:hypothetical protein